MMENYSKARTVERPSVCPFPGLPPDTPEIRVKDGSKIRNLLRYALSRLEAKPLAVASAPAQDFKDGRPLAPVEGDSVAKQPLCKHMVFTANGKGVAKAITCTEIVKRRVKGLHQITTLQFCTVDEVWEPLEPEAGLDSLTVSRKQPSIWILLSTDPLDRTQPGYQAPGRYDDLWAAATVAREEPGAGPKAGSKRKKGGSGGRGRGRIREHATKGHS